MSLDQNFWFNLGSISLTITIAGLFFGGLCKGAIGIGLPLIAVPIVALFVSVPKALSLLAIPLFVTNIYQLFQGGHAKAVIQRFWGITLALVIGIGLGTQILVSLDTKTLYLIMGLVVLAYPLIRLAGPSIQVSAKKERQIGPPIAFGSGFLGGISGFFAPPLLVFLAGQRLPKDLFTATVALIFLTGSLALSVFLAGHGILGEDDLVASAFSLAPIIAGIFLGQKIRAIISQTTFEKALTTAMAVIGVSMMWRYFS